jgi:hypothetical protein
MLAVEKYIIFIVRFSRVFKNYKILLNLLNSIHVIDKNAQRTGFIAGASSQRDNIYLYQNPQAYAFGVF